MDVSSLAAAAAGAKAAQTRGAVTTDIVKMAHEQSQQIANILAQAAEAGKARADAPVESSAGVVDVKV